MKKLLLFALLNFLLWFGYTSGFFAVNSLFITRAGADSLFQVYLTESLSFLGLSALIYLFVDRLPRRLFISGSFFLLAVATIFCWYALRAFPESRAVVFTVRIFAYNLFALTEILFWLAASSCFDGFEAKRWFPVVSAIGILGAIAGGFAAAFLASILHAENLPALWVVILLASPFFVWGSPFPPHQAHGPSTSLLLGEIIEPGGKRRVRSLFFSPLSVLLLVFWVSYTFLCQGNDFVFSATSRKWIPDPDHLTAFFGEVAAFASAGVFLYQLVPGPYLSQRFGIDRAVLFIVLLMASTLLFFAARPSLVSAVTAQGTVYFFVEEIAAARLATVMTVFPDRIRGRVPLFAEGFGRPLGNILVFLLAAVHGFHPSVSGTRTLMAEAAILFCVFPFAFRRTYLRHLLNCLRSSDKALVANAIQALGDRGKEEAAAPLLRLLRQSQAIDIQKNIVLTLGKIRSREAYPEIVRLMSTKDDKLLLATVEALNHYRNRGALLALYRSLLSGEKVWLQVRMKPVRVMTKLLGKDILPHLTSRLDGTDDRTHANIIEAIGFLKSRKTIPLLKPYLDHPHHRIRTNAAVALYPFLGTPERKRAFQTIESLFRSEKHLERRAALYAIGVLRLRIYRDPLRGIIEEAVDKKTLQLALTALACLKDKTFAPPFVRLLLDEDPAVAVETGRRLQYAPRTSRSLLFELISRLSEEDQSRIEYRLNETCLDFSREWALVKSSATSLLGTTVTSRLPIH